MTRQHTVTTKPGTRRRLELTAVGGIVVGMPRWRVVRGRGRLKVDEDGMAAWIYNARGAVIRITADAR